MHWKFRRTAVFPCTTGKQATPAFTGKMKDTGKGTIACSFDTDDFDPPACWGELEEEDTLQYEASGDDRIKLGYRDVWLTFSRVE